MKNQRHENLKVNGIILTLFNARAKHIRFDKAIKTIGFKRNFINIFNKTSQIKFLLKQ